VLKSHAAELEKRRAEEGSPRDAAEEEEEEEEEGEGGRGAGKKDAGMDPGLVEFAALVARDLTLTQTLTLSPSHSPNLALALTLTLPLTLTRSSLPPSSAVTSRVARRTAPRCSLYCAS
jgi:hypothetical protein